jgi:hypothetical protein
MVWYAWALIALSVIGFLLNVWSIDRPKNPTTRGQVVVHAVIAPLYIWAIVSLAT